MRGKQCGFSILIGLLLLIALLGKQLSPGTVAYGEEKKETLPTREISIDSKYTGIVISEGDDLVMDLFLVNWGSRGENINVMVESAPEGWQTWIKSYSDYVTGIHVPSGETKVLTLNAKPGKKVGPGQYTFLVKAQTTDKAFSSLTRVNVKIKEKEDKKETKGVEIDTNYPVLQGPTDAEFEFALNVLNQLDKGDTFNFSSQGPENWEIRFKPAYEEKYISSLIMKERQTQSIAVEVKPSPFAEPGEYPIKVRVASPTSYGEIDLKIVLTGTYKIEVGTADGRLSLNASQGKPANISFYVKNSGSATYHNVRFLSFKPENWKVEFNPETVASLAPGDLKQVEATIIPAEQALVGDYSVGLIVEGETTSENIEIRVTVRASTAWGWIGIGIIVLVIASLVVMFIRLGRR